MLKSNQLSYVYSNGLPEYLGLVHTDQQLIDFYFKDELNETDIIHLWNEFIDTCKDTFTTCMIGSAYIYI